MSDPRLELVTLTGVDVSRDLAHAKVYYSTLTATAVDGRGVDSRGRGDRAAGRPARTCAASSGARCASARCRASTFARRSRDRLRSAHRGHPARDPPPRGVERTRVVARATRRTRERRSSGRGGADPGGRARSAPRPRSASRVTSVPTATRSARCSRCTTCCARRASTSVASFSEPFVVAPHYRELPGLELLTPPDQFPREPQVMVTFDSGSLARLGDLEPPAKAAGELDRDRPSRLEPALRHHQRDRSRRGRERCARAPADRPARAPADARRGGVPLRRARVRHRSLPVPVDDARRCSSSRASSRASTSRSPSCRARCSRSTGSRTCSCSPRRCSTRCSCRRSSSSGRR